MKIIELLNKISNNEIKDKTKFIMIKKKLHFLIV